MHILQFSYQPPYSFPDEKQQILLLYSLTVLNKISLSPIHIELKFQLIYSVWSKIFFKTSLGRFALFLEQNFGVVSGFQSQILFFFIILSSMLNLTEISQYAQAKGSPIGSVSTFDGEELPSSHVVQWEPSWKKCQVRSPQTYSFCPFCGKFISEQTINYACKSERGQSYACHEDCLDQSRIFTDYPQKSLECKNDPFMGIPELMVGTGQFLIKIKIQHPLSSFKYFQVNIKGYETKNRVICNLIKEDSSMLEPNMVVIPLQEFKISLSIQDLKSPERTNSQLNFKALLDFQTQQQIKIQVSNQVLTFFGCFEIVTEERVKEEIIDHLNFKYIHEHLHSDLIIFKKFLIQINSSAAHKIMGQERTPLIDEQVKDIQLSHLQKNANEGNQQQKSDKELVEQLKTQQGSKEFQKSIKNLKPPEIQEILEKILPYTQQMILDEYANYMFQSLLKACNCSQRLLIIEQIKPKIHKIVCQKQGTFVLQLFISLFTNSVQFEKVSEFLFPHFDILTMDQNGNHFMRKFIELMPAHLLKQILYISISNIVLFGTHKNAVCVMKSLMRALKEAEVQEYYIHLCTQFLNSIISNAHSLINDEFGNYLIQEALQKFDLERLHYLNQFICQNFYLLSLEKYSSNVVIQCLKKYWRNYPDIYHSVQSILTQQVVLELYKAKDSNKVLLQAMELPFDHPLKQKILSFLTSNDAFCKFNESRWSKILGNKKAKSQASKQGNNQSQKRKKSSYNN